MYFRSASLAPLSVCSGELVLLVDDEDAVREIIGATLEAHGYRVVTATDGIEGLKIFREKAADIHLVLTDINMPGMNGDAMIREIRRLNPSVGVIATSGSGPEAWKAMRSIERSVTLLKPYTTQELLEAMKKALAG
jgi:two-component system cell cycle sensor histidine kinase/response regulator CckA